MAQVHDFYERRAFSLSASHEPFWNAIYERAFTGITKTELVTDLDLQRQGIDRLIYLDDGRTVKVDEKKRDKAYPDILLEYLADDQRNTPGWMEKPLMIDYLAYAFMPTRRVYLFDWLILRRAWTHYSDTWRHQYRTVKAYNVGYCTLSVAVPIGVLQRAVTTAAVIQLTNEWVAA